MTETHLVDGASPHRLASPRSPSATRKAGQEKHGDDQQCRGAGYSRNHDVLAIDMDPQADMTKGL